MINKFIFSAILLIAVFIIGRILKKSIDLIFMKVKRRVAQKRILAKTRTLRSILYNIIDIVLFLIAILVILSGFGVNIVPILTGAGILGLAISFGSQTLVKDFISGIFILIEDLYNVGDAVKIANFEGEVHKINLRTTEIIDKDNNLVFIPNSLVTTVVRIGKKKA